MDGFTITKGYADVAPSIYVAGLEIFDRSGVGWHNFEGSPIMSNLIITDNRWGVNTSCGGGLYTKEGSPELWNVTIHNNGGGVSSSGVGGGLYMNYGNPVLNNVAITGNGGSNTGAWEIDGSNVVANNVTVAGNWCVAGTQVISIYNDAVLTMRNSIVYGNAVSTFYTGMGFPFDLSELNLFNTLIEGRVGGTDGNLDGTTLNPEFVSPELPSSAPTSAGDYSLSAASPCIYAGDNDYVPVSMPSDLGGFTRIVNDTVDMGAFEFGDVPLSVDFVDISVSVSDCNVTLMWNGKNEVNLSHYEIQASTDGNNFAAIGEIPAKNLVEAFYSSENIQQEHTCYYRIKAFDIDGTTGYSPILPVSVDCATPVITLSPNPATDYVTLRGTAFGQYLQVVDMSGRVVLKTALSGTSFDFSVKDFVAGLYQAIVISGSGQIMLTSKFVVM